MILALETNVMDIISKNKQVSFRGVPPYERVLISESFWECERLMIVCRSCRTIEAAAWTEKERERVGAKTEIAFRFDCCVYDIKTHLTLN